MKYTLLILLFIMTVSCKSQDESRTNFPVQREKVTELPSKDNLWIFILAGQSNMAGRGFVEPKDTIANPRILSLGENKEWFYAKEPLHFYEPNLTGLDCGLSFANELLKNVPDGVTIGLIPCAVGGSAISQWNNDEVYRDVQLLSNFKERVASVQNQGTIKGILWHQGESDAKTELIPKYESAINELFSIFRKTVRNDSTPILVAELGSFMQPQEEQEKFDSINKIISKAAGLDKNRHLITTGDLNHKGDNLHFNSEAQRTMGIRFAKKYVEEVLR